MWKNLTATRLACGLVTVAMTALLHTTGHAQGPYNADEQFAPTAVVSLPHGQILSAFDISFVSPETHTLAVAAARVVGDAGPFGAVIIVDTTTNTVTKELTGFVGDCSTPPKRDTISGPSGVIVIETPATAGNADVWVGDGPVFNTPCTPASGLKTPSTVKVFNLNTGALIASIPTGTGQPGTLGVHRADELCYNPVLDVVLMANDDPEDNFITFIGEDSLAVIQRIRFDGTDPNGAKLLANGIEQCAFNPRDGKFYLNLPNTGPASSPGPGVVLRIEGDGSTANPFHVEVLSDFSTAPLNATGCGGAAGMAVGPDHQIGLACGGANALVIDDRTGQTVLFGMLIGEGGADEMWYNPTRDQYFFARTGATALGVVDAGSLLGTGFPVQDPSAKTAPGSHSVAADSVSNQVYVPIRGNNGTVPPTAPPSPVGAICSTAKDVFGNAGSDALGCIAIYTAPEGAF